MMTRIDDYCARDHWQNHLRQQRYWAWKRFMRRVLPAVAGALALGIWLASKWPL